MISEQYHYSTQQRINLLEVISAIPITECDINQFSVEFNSDLFFVMDSIHPLSKVQKFFTFQDLFSDERKATLVKSSAH